MRFRFSAAPFVVGFLFLTLLAGAIVPQVLYAQTLTDERRAELQRELQALEKEIADNQAVVNNLAAQGKSLSTEVQTLNAQIKKAQLQVQATQVAIRQLDSSITVHQKTITNLNDKLSAEKKALAQILRKTDEIDNFSIVELAFSTGDLSSLLGDLDSFTFVKRSLGTSYETITGNKLQTESEKQALEQKRLAQQQLASLQLQAKQKVVDQQSQKQQLLVQTKGQESKYQQIVQAKQKTAAQIRSELFGLAGGGGAIPFGVASDDAKIASRITGVRPALILAILSQESDLGKNTGQCLVTDLTTGDGKGKNSGTPFLGVMKAPRDTAVFLRLMDALGRSWSTTAVSCPQSGGYGGAMGPTQFIPSTWAIYESRIKSALGISAADPWNALHAITATGLYLADVGAAGGSAQAEHTAAAKYYAGGGWATYGQVYADSVMDKAAAFQKDIDTLNGK
ncbi:MAG: lytic murein transglycosylase [Patescibacteria group bacterium]